MDAQEFKKDFLQDVKTDAASTGEGTCASFVSAFARYLQEAEYLLTLLHPISRGQAKETASSM